MMKLIHSCCLSCFPLHQIPVPSSSNTLPGCCLWPPVCCVALPPTDQFAIHLAWTRQAKRDTASLRLIGVSGHRPEQGGRCQVFCDAKDVGTRPLPCTVSFCNSPAAGELMRLSTRLSLHFGSTVDSRVVVGCLKLVRLSERLSHWLCRLSYHLSYRLSRHDLQDVRWRLAAFNPAQVGGAEVSARQPASRNRRCLVVNDCKQDAPSA